MQRHILIGDDYSFLDPCWLRSVSGKNFDVEVDEQGKVTIDGKKHHFKDTPLPSGTKVRASLLRFFECVTIEDIQKHEQINK